MNVDENPFRAYVQGFCCWLCHCLFGFYEQGYCAKGCLRNSEDAWLRTRRAHAASPSVRAGCLWCSHEGTSFSQKVRWTTSQEAMSLAQLCLWYPYEGISCSQKICPRMSCKSSIAEDLLRRTSMRKISHFESRSSPIRLFHINNFPAKILWVKMSEGPPWFWRFHPS